LNNLGLVIFVVGAINSIKIWVKIFPFAHVLDDLIKLFDKLNKLDKLKCLVKSWDILCYCSAQIDGRGIITNQKGGLSNVV
jgi:hypothetical protein